MRGSGSALRMGQGGEEQQQREKTEEWGGARDAARLPGGACHDGHERGQEGGIDEGDDGGGGAKQEPGRDGGPAAAAEREQEDGGKSAGGEAGLPEDGGNPEQGKREGPECAGEDGGAVVEHLASDAHHEPDGDEADENLQGDDGDLGGEGVRAEDEEESGDEGGIAGRDQGGGAGRDAEGRAEAVAVEERVGQQTHLVGVGEEPVVRSGGGNIHQDHEAAKQCHAKDDGERTVPARANPRGGGRVREVAWEAVRSWDGWRADRAMVSDAN